MKKSVKDKQRRRGVMDLPKAIEERLDEGRAERESVPLEAHGEWPAPADRPDPVACWSRRTRRVCPSWCRSGTGG